VVDKNLKVHEVRNLYLAGSSVFPRGGLPGPTMLLVAMARRLALHLQERMSSS
jgi:choline dehydrogenase-like flavoprotein